jgi:hypothetical protein
MLLKTYSGQQDEPRHRRSVDAFGSYTEIGITETLVHWHADLHSVTLFRHFTSIQMRGEARNCWKNPYSSLSEIRLLSCMILAGFYRRTVYKAA